MVTASKLAVNTNASATAMANEIFGAGVTVTSASYSGDRLSSGVYTGGNATSPGVVPGDRGVILSTGRAQDFTNNTSSFLQANQSTSRSTDTSGQTNNADFNAAAGATTYDASYLTVNFVPTGGVLTMRFVFASEEYPEYTYGIYQDFVGVWVNGQQVDLTVGDGDVDPNNLNNTSNQNLFVDNTSSQFNTEMDGFTVTMTLKMVVNPGVTNTIRIGIADVNDAQYDSAVLIAGDSVQTAFIARDDSVTMSIDTSATINVLGNDGTTGSSLTITHINGQAVVAGSTITLPTGQQVTLNANGTLSILGDDDTESYNFTYTARTSAGVSDVAFVTVDQVPCFVAGTLILTPEGERAVETLLPGDLVMTQDDGPQPLRWIGRRRVAAAGELAPIRIAADTFGSHRALVVSPLHRIMIRDALAELLFGEGEVLVAAKDLVNDRSVQRIEGGMVEYVHILFDRHQVVLSEGLASESFLPGPQITRSFEAAAVAEICRIFPELDPLTGDGYSPAARRTLKSYEARVLSHGKVA